MKSLRLHPQDSVAVVLQPVVAGERLDELGITANEAIEPGHKIALCDLAEGAAVHKYNQVIGLASTPIAAGDWVHVHNLAMTEAAGEAVLGSNVPAVELVAEPAKFNGIVRDDGRVATRNYIAVVTSVNCSGSVARAIAAKLTPEIDSQYPNIDGIAALTHAGGCAIDGKGEGLQQLRRTLTGIMQHPNFSHVLVVGLGCEANQVDALLASNDWTSVELASGKRLQPLLIQNRGGSVDAVAAGVEIIRGWLPEANRVERQPVPVSKLILGLQCGGSDAFSGVTANPALGAACDLLVRHGATVVLSETPEIYGAEHLLLSRAVSREVGEQLLARIDWWQDYVARQGGSLDNNPSPGNKAGGLTTIQEKSLGAVAKAGASPLSAVYKYAEPITERGLVFMDTPGYDPVSVTGQLAGGANIIAFTTGRGSVFGCKPAPSLKLATNSALYQSMTGDMDINCGDILDGHCTLQEKGQQIFDLIVATASGRQSKSEALGVGDIEFVPWSLGAVL